MKIGTITYHKANNYGAVLQTYALYKYLENLGHNSSVIDYWPEYHAKMYGFWHFVASAYRSQKGAKKYFYIVARILLYPKFVMRKRKFDEFRERHIKTSKYSSQYYDAVFYGSDTIWNVWKNNTYLNGFDPVLWGSEEIKSKYKFSYAPSMGDVIDTNDTRDFCDKMLTRFSLLSVRESNLYAKLKDWGWNNVVKVVDPTFLLKNVEWDIITPPAVIGGEYAVCYNLERSPIIDALAKELRNNLKIRVVTITGSATKNLDKDIMDTIGPSEFLSLFKHAKYILTSSFHGVAFSIIFEKRFCFNSQKETERISSLLTDCNLVDRFIKVPDIRILESPIDYDNVRMKVKMLREDSYDFINRCLNIAGNGN